MEGSMEVYRPLMGGTFARNPYAIPWGTRIVATVIPAMKSCRRDVPGESLKVRNHSEGGKRSDHFASLTLPASSDNMRRHPSPVLALPTYSAMGSSCVGRKLVLRSSANVLSGPSPGTPRSTPHIVASGTTLGAPLTHK